MGKPKLIKLELDAEFADLLCCHGLDEKGLRIVANKLKEKEQQARASQYQSDIRSLKEFADNF